MLDASELKAASETFLTAALVGEGWTEALSALASAAGARGAVLMRNSAHKLVASITTEEVAEPVAAFAQGKTPPSPRQMRVQPGLSEGFRIDQDDFTKEELAREPFYQEFLRPLGFFWHANARLEIIPGECVTLSFKRALNAGPYSQEDASALNRTVANLRGAARVAHRILDANGAGVAGLLQRRGDPVFELDAWGRVLRWQTGAQPDEDAIRVQRNRLCATDGREQQAVDRAVMKAASQGATAAATLLGTSGRRYVLQVVPVLGIGRDVFRATAAVAVLITPRSSQLNVFIRPGEIVDAFALSKREADVAVMLARGLSVQEIAARLNVQVGTARNHLKSIFDKTGTHRQGELIALLATLAA